MKLSKQKKKEFLLLSKKKENGGRNNYGRITVNHKGGGHKQLYRKIELNSFLNNDLDQGFITNIEYDPNRSAFIAKICLKSKNNNLIFKYIIAPKEIKVLDTVSLNKNNINYFKFNDIEKGNFYFMHEFKVGDLIHNIQPNINKTSTIVRSAGTFAKILKQTSMFSLVQLPSGEERIIPAKSKASLGQISNENYRNIIIGKAGRSRWLNIRPTVRGVAMNPIDHPHGGNTGGGKHPKTPWSRLTKGKPTKNLKKKNKYIINLKKKNV